MLCLAAFVCLAANAQEPSETPSGQVTIETVPAGIAVTIDGKPRGASPARVVLPEGHHSYSVFCPHTGAWRREFELSAGQMATYRVSCPTAIHPSGFSSGEPAERTENFAVETRPAGMKIWIDGKARGQSPLRTDLSPGRHNLAVNCPGGEMHDSFVILDEIVRSYVLSCDESARRAALGDVVIQTDPPGQKVLIDGVPRGPSPAEIILSPGTHSYTVECPDTARYEKTFSIAAGLTRTYSINCSGD